jgi:hypothetical protein
MHQLLQHRPAYDPGMLLRFHSAPKTVGLVSERISAKWQPLICALLPVPCLLTCLQETPALAEALP